MMTEQLKPCPFCGSEDIKKYGGGYAQEAPVTACKSCHAECLGHELWNNRPAENKLKADAVREASIEMDESQFNKFGVFSMNYIAAKESLLKYADKLERGE